MSLDNIQLPATVIQQLFNNSLVDLNMEQPTRRSAAGPTFNVLGNNNKHILILVSNDAIAHLPEDELKFLSGILTACKLSLEDVAILNIKKNKEQHYQAMTAELKPSAVLLFGIKLSQIELPLEFPYYQVQQYNHQTYLSAPGLSELQNNVSEKAKLWNCLKQLFSI